MHTALCGEELRGSFFQERSAAFCKECKAQKYPWMLTQSFYITLQGFTLGFQLQCGLTVSLLKLLYQLRLPQTTGMFVFIHGSLQVYKFTSS